MSNCDCSNPSLQAKTTLQDSSKARRRTPKAEKDDKDREDRSGQQIFDGQTWSCVACKLGHRVKQCTHGRTKPISPTNPPGRPARGSKRKCECSSSCTCPRSGPCTCGSGCVCVQQMWLMVYIDPLSTAPESQDVIADTMVRDVNGKDIALRTVWTDTNGRELSDEEYMRRQEVQKERVQKSCCGIESTTVNPIPQASPQVDTGCRHRQASAIDTLETPATMQNISQVKQCNCGGDCTCIMCPEHPNNEATRKYNVQQVRHMMAQENPALFPSQNMTTGMPYVPHTPERSCMGGPATYFFSRSPIPTHEEIQGAFPNGPPLRGYQIAYPIDAIVPFVPHTSLPSTQFLDTGFHHDRQPQHSNSYVNQELSFDLPSLSNNVFGTQFTFGNASVNTIAPTYVSPYSTPSHQSYHAADMHTGFGQMSSMVPPLLNNSITPDQQYPDNPFNSAIQYTQASQVMPPHINSLARTHTIPGNSVDVTEFQSGAFPSAQSGFRDPMLSGFDDEDAFMGHVGMDDSAMSYLPSTIMDFSTDSSFHSDFTLSPSSPLLTQDSF